MAKKNKKVEEPIEKPDVVESEPIQIDIKALVEEPIVNETISEEQKEEMMAAGAEVIAEEIENNILEEVKNLAEEKTEPQRIEEALEKMKAKEQPKEVHFEFQDEYHFGHNSDEDAVIDELPVEEEKPLKSIANLTKSELREFQRTGKLPK